MTIPEAWRGRVGSKSNRAEDIRCMSGNLWQSLLHRYPSYSPKRRLRRTPLPTTILVHLHADLIQPRAMALHEQYFTLVARIRLTQQDSRMQLQVLRDTTKLQKIEQPHVRASWILNWRLAKYRRELGRDGRECAGRGEHSQMRDALCGVRVHRD